MQDLPEIIARISETKEDQKIAIKIRLLKTYPYCMFLPFRVIS